MPLTPRRVSVAASLALALAAFAPALPIGQSTALAGGGLVTVTDLTYEVQPDNALVHVTIDAVSTSYEADTPEGQIYYSGLTFSVPPGSANFAASSGGVSLAVRVVESTADSTRVEVTFSQGVFYRQSYAYRVSFDMIDSGGEADRDLRVGHSVVAFPVWALGTAGASGGSVQVVLPPTFSPSVYGDAMTEAAQANGTTLLTATAVDDPSTWFAYVIAERPGIFVTNEFMLQVGEEEATVVIRAWDDDPAWASGVQELLTDGLPALHELIGLPWPVVGDLKVEESANIWLGEYAGIYNKLTEKINVRYDADATVTLHEAAHIWFNADLFRDRWIGEAWAEFYAGQAAQAIGATGDVFELTDALLAVKIPLNDWGAIATESQEVEEYAYAASYHLAVLVFERTDIGALQAVWRAANDGEMAYQPPHADGRPISGVALTQEGWQRLLDLLEERTDAAYDDLWSAWVINDAQRPLLTERTDTRERYQEVVTSAAEWELPQLIRYDLSSWQFADVMAELDEAEEVLTVRDRIDTLATELDLTPPTALQTAFEGNNGLAAALDEATEELASAQAIDEAAERLADEPGIVEWVGLLFVDAEADLAAARDAWEAGDSVEAASQAEAALTARDGAEAAGGQRLLVGGAGSLLIVGGGAAVVWRRRRPKPAAEADESGTPEAGGEEGRQKSDEEGRQESEEAP